MKAAWNRLVAWLGRCPRPISQAGEERHNDMPDPSEANAVVPVPNDDSLGRGGGLDQKAATTESSGTLSSGERGEGDAVPDVATLDGTTVVVGEVPVHLAPRCTDGTRCPDLGTGIVAGTCCAGE